MMTQQPHFRGRRRQRHESSCGTTHEDSGWSDRFWGRRRQVALYLWLAALWTHGVQANNNNNVAPAASGYIKNPNAFLDVQAGVCRNHAGHLSHGPIQVKVQSVYFACDSPGAYYKGSHTYRNSAVCLAGDKGNLVVTFSIDTVKRQSGNYNPSQIWDDYTVYVALECGLYDSYVSILAGRPLCQQDVSPAYYGDDDPAESCPAAGQYVWKTYFTVPSGLALSDDDALHFTPDVRFYFFVRPTNVDYDDDDGNNDSGGDDDDGVVADSATTTTPRGVFVGCATTGSAAWHRSREMAATRGVVLLGCATVSFLLLFGLLLYLSHRRRKRLERLVERKTLRFRYFRTLPNGQVVPFPPQLSSPTQQHYQHPYPTQQQQEQLYRHLQQQQYNMQQGGGGRNILPANSLDSSHNSMSPQAQEPPTPPQPPLARPGVPMISNPSYNETHLPTRPII